MMLNMGVMTNNMAAVVNLLVFFLTVSVHNLLTLLNVGGVDNLLALLVLLFLGDLVALLVLLVMTLWSMGVSMMPQHQLHACGGCYIHKSHDAPRGSHDQQHESCGEPECVLPHSECG